MRRRYVGLAVFLVAVAVASAWVVTDTPGPAQTVQVETVPSEPRDSPPLSLEELMAQVTDNLTGRPLCEAPPVEVPEELKREIEKVLSTLPPPPTAPTDPPPAGDIVNIHRRVVPC